MPSRRALLTLLTGSLAGCYEADITTPTPTATEPPATPTPVPVSQEVIEALNDRDIEGSPACPGAVPCFHRYDRHARPETIAVPSTERVTPSQPETTITTYNFGNDTLVLGTPVWVGKWTDLHWTPTIGPDVPNDVVVVEANETIERTFRIGDRGDGLYAVIEEGYFGEPRDPATQQPDTGGPRELRGDTFRFGAVFSVEGSTWELTRDDDVPVEQDGETLYVHPDRTGDRELVLDAVDQTEGLPLIHETIAAHPPTKHAIFGLTRDGVTQVRMPSDGTAMWYLAHGVLFPLDIHEDRVLRLHDVVFNAWET